MERKIVVSKLTWWMRIVGGLYLFLFVAAAFLRLPIQMEGPPGILERADAGDVTARFVVDTWVVLGLELGAIGAALLIASRVPSRAIALVWFVIGSELIWGIGSDLYKLARGYAAPTPLVWILIHSAIIVTGLLALRSVRSSNGTATDS
jgi:hypothetical protein